MTWMYTIRHESDAGEAIEQFLVDVRADGVPSAAHIV